MKRTFYTELSYLVGLVVLALGTALMELADFGMSMVVAPAYVCYLKLSGIFPWFTFGMAEYCFQALLILVLSIALLQFRRRYLFSFITAFVYGNILDLVMRVVGLLPEPGFAGRIVCYVLGLLACALGVAFLFHTYISPEAYELCVKEIAGKTKKELSLVKTIYDCCSCLLAVLLSFVFFGLFVFEGVKLGTVICALINGWLIGVFGNLLERVFVFRDGLKRKE